MADDEKMAAAVEELRKRVAELAGDVRGPDAPRPEFLRGAAGSAESLSLDLKPRALLRGHFKKVVDLQWSAADDMTLLSAAQDSKLLLWNVKHQLRINVVPLPSAWVMACALSPSGRLTAAGGLDNTVSVYKLVEPAAPNQPEKREKPKKLEGHDGYVGSIRFLSDEEVVSGSGDQSVCLYNVSRGLQRQMYGHTEDVSSVDVFDAHELLVSGSVDGTARLWDHRVRGGCVGVFTDHGEEDVNDVTFMPDGYSFVTGSEDGTCRVFDTRARAAVVVLTNPNEAVSEEVSSVATSTTGRFIVAGFRRGYMRAYDTLTGAVAWQSPDQTASVSCVGVSRDGVGVAMGVFDNTVSIFG